MDITPGIDSALPNIEKIPDFNYSEFEAYIVDGRANHADIVDAASEGNLRQRV